MHFTLVTLCFVALFGTSISRLVPLNQYHNKKAITDCKKATHITPAGLKSLIVSQLPKTKNESCFLACWQKKLRLRNADNTINMDRIEDIVIPLIRFNKFYYKQTMQVYTDCAEQESTKDDECTAARKYSECVMSKLHQIQRPTITVDKYIECVNKSEICAVDLVHVILRNVPKSREAGCLIGCVEKQFGILDSMNKINMTQVYKRFMLHRQPIFNKYVGIYKKCRETEIAPKDTCDAGLKYAKCLFQNEKLNATHLVQ